MSIERNGILLAAGALVAVLCLLFLIGCRSDSKPASNQIVSQLPPEQLVKGVHLIRNFGESYGYLGENIEVEHVVALLRKQPWRTEFLQFVVVIQPGISMEVGGSLNDVDGLSAFYRNRLAGKEAVTKVAPESVDELEWIIRSFLMDDQKWKSLFDF